MMQKLGRFDDMFDMVLDFDRLLRRPSWHLAPANFFNPAVECFTRDKMLVLRVELPGVDPKEVEVSVTGGQLFIRGEKKEEKKIDEKDFFFREIGRGRFERNFSLPEGAKADELKASFLNGVLELTMPLFVVEASRKIPIETREVGKMVKVA
jgi:HSP20 family protein